MGPDLPAWFHFTGPLIDPASRAAVPFAWHQLSDKPLIYASLLGTIQNQQLGLFAAIAAACQHLDAQLVIAPGGAVCAAAGVAATRQPHHHPCGAEHGAGITPLWGADGGDPDRQ